MQYDYEDEDGEVWEHCDHAADAMIEWLPVDTQGPERDWQWELVILCGECGWSCDCPVTWRCQADIRVYGPGGKRA